MMEIRRMGPIGAEITGVDVKTMDDAAFSKIYQAWLDSNVIVVRDQSLQIGDYLRYSLRFGVISPHPSKSTRHPECPEVTLLGANKFRADGRLDTAIYSRGAQGFHTDGSYEKVPFKATQLYALAIPSRGGDTFFSSGYAAYEELPPHLKQRLEGRMGTFKYGGLRKLNALLNEEDRNVPPVRHPLVQVHPETGRKSLFIGGKVKQIVGMHPDESATLVQFLCNHAAQPRFLYRHQWQKEDVLLWDNRCTNHIGLGDYDRAYPRNIDRTTVKGLPAGYAYSGPVHYQGPRL